MKIVAICVFVLSFAVSIAMAAGKPPKAVDIPITQQIFDTDNNSNPYYIQSDGLGDYLHTMVKNKGTTTGTNSVLMENVCGGLYNGDRLLDTSFDVRKVTITFDNTNAIQPGDPNYRVPALFTGIVLNRFRNMNTCTCGTGQSMYTMAAGTTIYCPMHFRLNGVNYRLEMIGNDNETDPVQIVCNAADNAGCSEWTIDPIPDPNHPTDPGKTRARLVDLGNGNADIGDYYMTFHLHVTRP